MSLFKKLFKGASSNEDGALDCGDFVKLDKPNFNTFSELLEQNAALSYEKQFNFGDLIGSNPWQFDMSKGEISFGNKLFFPVQIIGSISFNDNSWMWGWANSQSNIPENLLTQSYLLKKIGEEKGIEEFTNPHFCTDAQFDHQVGMIASGLFKSSCYYSANYGNGSLVCTINSSIIPVLKNSPEKLLATFTQLVADFEVSHKDAFKSYLIDKGYLLKMTDNTIVGLKGKDVVTAEFDSLNRLLSIKNK